MPFGPTPLEALLLFQLPFLIGLALVVWLVLSWRGFIAMVVAGTAFVLYVLVGFSSLRSAVGAIMLLFSFWVAVLLLALAAYFSGVPRIIVSLSATRRAEDGRWWNCPLCDLTSPQASHICLSCGASKPLQVDKVG
jgi:hypothetical protein